MKNGNRTSKYNAVTHGILAETLLARDQMGRDLSSDSVGSSESYAPS
jgi:hypothetical protein